VDQDPQASVTFAGSGFVVLTILISAAEPEAHLLVGAGAVTRCGSGSDNGIKHGWEWKIDTKCNSL
jgi:hypothetical protein